MPSASNTITVVGTAGVPTLVADNVNKALQIQVTPLSTNFIRWNATVKITNVAF
jgi:hypothetical protein